MARINCPVKGCPGYKTTAGNSNLIVHLRGIAKTELFDREFLHSKKTPHVDYIKKHHQVIKTDETKLIIKTKQNVNSKEH